MRNRYSLPVLALVVLAVFAAADAGAQFYAVDNYSAYIYSYEDTVGTIANPDTLPPWVQATSLDHGGDLLLGVDNDGTGSIARFDFDEETIDYLEFLPLGHVVLAVEPDLGDDIYALVEEGGWKSDEKGGGRQDDPYLGVLFEGGGLLEVVYEFTTGYPIDMVVRPSGPQAGNILVLVESEGSYILELERTEADSFVFYDVIADGGMLPTQATAMAIDPNGTIIVLDYTDGLHYVEEEYGYVWGFGIATGPGLRYLTIASDGTIYVGNSATERIQRYDAGGYPIGNPFGQDIYWLGPIAAVGYTPTPEGENVLIEPGENIEITFEEVTGEGFTSAQVTTTTSRVSPEGNPLPDHAQLPGTRADDFSYILIATNAIYEGLIQVDVLEEGSRLFYASGVGDTFRDFTVVGSIEDARGTIPRFEELLGTRGRRFETGPTEVVLVEDDRTLPEVTAYKFWRLELAMEVPDNMPGGDPCPWEYIEWLQKYHQSAREYYDAADFPNALSELAIMNGMVRSHAGWCIPDSSDDPLGNMVGHILAHSKTLMYSIELENGAVFTGIDEDASSISLVVSSPARGECRFALSGPVGTEVAARVYSVSGKLVATVYEGRLPDGGETFVWNGMDETGRPIASGVYFARVESDSGVLTSKVVFIR